MASQPQPIHALRRRSAPRIEILSRRKAAPQEGVVTRRELLAAEVSASSIDEQVARGRLIVLHRGIYLVATAIRPPHAEEMAAQLAVGGEAAIGYVAAARIRGLDLPERLADATDVTIDIIAPGKHRRQREGVRLHFASLEIRWETSMIGRLRVTTSARTILDLTPSLEDRELEQLVAHALRNRLVRRRQLDLQLRRSRGRTGVPRLRRILDGPLRMVRSVREGELVAVLAAAGIDPPLTNERVEGRELDAYWPMERVGIEVQSMEHHAFEDALEADSEKASLFGALGYTILPFTPSQLRRSPELVVARTRAALELARRRNRAPE